MAKPASNQSMATLTNWKFNDISSIVSVFSTLLLKPCHKKQENQAAIFIKSTNEEKMGSSL